MALAWDVPVMQAPVGPATTTRLVEAVCGVGALGTLAASDTVRTTLFDIGWPDAPHRVIRNDTLVNWDSAGRTARGRRPGEDDVIATRSGKPLVRYSDAQPTTDTRGEISSMALYAGMSVELVYNRASADAITREIAGGLGLL